MRNWEEESLHLFVTSRDKPSIREFLQASLSQEIKMRNNGIDNDIAEFISGQLYKDPRLRKWSAYRARIQERLLLDA